MAFAKVSREAKMSRHGSIFANKGKIVRRHQSANKTAANLECESRIYINEQDESETWKMNRENESKTESKTFKRKLSEINAKRKMVYVSPLPTEK